MLIYEGEHKCVTLQEVGELEEFLLARAVKRNNKNFNLSISNCLDGTITKETEKSIEILSSVYKFHDRIVLQTELSVVNPHKGSLLLSYKVMDWS